MRSRAITLGLLLPLGFLSACATPNAPQVTSWGKAGVSYANYRTDAVHCATIGAKADMSGQTAYKDTLRGVEQQDTILQDQQALDPLTDYVMIQRRNFHVNIPELQQYLVSVMTRCLVSRGYSEFALTPDQAAGLAKMKKGTEERFHYLYELATDPDIVSNQAVREDSAKS
ncbi:hypothetical protein [Tsuneonella mangrovi]|uniref:hypothetical protein n=1 Tax=Tsuneonella mangrovi TaxID=1982042 RepID=UPI00123771DC|nr:hypothetical protein [Tsuneonella mangrovi]